MLPALAPFLDPPPRFYRAWLHAALLISLMTGSAAAFDLTLLPPHLDEGWVRVRLQLSDVVTPRLEASLERGMPATLQLRAELWRRRAGWFHKLESSLEFSLKIRYDVWSQTYRIERRNAPEQVISSIDSVRHALTVPVLLPIAPVEQLTPGPRYYGVVTATLKPLTVEDVAEGEGWLSGEVENKRRAGLGIITALPRAVFDAMRNFAGLGDLSARQITPDFGLQDLPGP